MSRAKLTFRLEPTYKSHDRPESRTKEQQVVPLHAEAYKVIPVDTQSLHPYPHDFGGWQSSFDMETQRVEKLIRESSHVQAPEDEFGNPTMQEQWRHNPLGHERSHQSASSPNEALYDWNYESNLDAGTPSRTFSAQEDLVSNDPNQGIHTDPLRDHRWYVPEEHAYRSKSTMASWLKVTASIVGAVATGAAFGFLVLSMFTDDSQSKEASVAATTPANITTTAATPAKTAAPDQAIAVSGNMVSGGSAAKAGGDKSTAAVPSASIAVSASAASGALTAVNVPARTLTFLQNGVFSTSQAAAGAQTELKKKGVAAVSDVGDKYPVYVAMTSNRDQASQLAKQLQQKKIDVIVKNVELPALSKIKWNGKSTEAISAFITQGDNLVQQIAPLTVAHLSEAKPTGLDAKLLQSVKTTHQAWIGTTTGVNEGLAEEGKTAVLKISNALNTAVASLDDYQKNPSTLLLWQTQNAILQAALAQKEFRRIILAA